MLVDAVRPPRVHWGAAPRLSGSVIVIGAFDGVHRGHQGLIAGAIKAARARGVPSVVWTFDPPPKVFFGRAAQLLCVADRVDRICFFGPDHIVVSRFDDSFRRRSAHDFIADLAALNPVELRVGADFRFGAGQAGDVDMLARHFDTRIEPLLVCPRGDAISSTRIRAALGRGDLALAEALQGWAPLLGTAR